MGSCHGWSTINRNWKYRSWPPRSRRAEWSQKSPKKRVLTACLVHLMRPAKIHPATAMLISHTMNTAVLNRISCLFAFNRQANQNERRCCILKPLSSHHCSGHGLEGLRSSENHAQSTGHRGLTRHTAGEVTQKLPEVRFLWAGWVIVRTFLFAQATKILKVED